MTNKKYENADILKDLFAGKDVPRDVKLATALLVSIERGNIPHVTSRHNGDWASSGARL